MAQRMLISFGVRECKMPQNKCFRPFISRLTSVFCTPPRKIWLSDPTTCSSFRAPDLHCAARKTVLRGTWDEQAGDPIRSRTPCPHPLVVSKAWKPPQNFGFVKSPAPTYIFQSPHLPKIFSKGPSGNNLIFFANSYSKCR